MILALILLSGKWGRLYVEYELFLHRAVVDKLQRPSTSHFHGSVKLLAFKSQRRTFDQACFGGSISLDGRGFLRAPTAMLGQQIIFTVGDQALGAK
jgi:hypothetical protein